MTKSTSYSCWIFFYVRVEMKFLFSRDIVLFHYSYHSQARIANAMHVFGK